MRNGIKRNMVWAVALPLALLAGSVTAGGWSGRQVLDRVVHRDDRIVMVYGSAGLWANPDSCDDSSLVVLLSPGLGTHPAVYNEQYAALLGAQLSGHEVSAFVQGCHNMNGTTVPIVTRVAVY